MESSQSVEAGLAASSQGRTSDNGESDCNAESSFANSFLSVLG